MNETVGKISRDLIIKQVDDTHSAHEQMQECLTDFDENLLKCLEDGKAKYTGDFYVIVLTKKERLMPNVLRNYFLVRLTCPTPEFDQAVYQYKKTDDEVHLLWVVPSKDTVAFMKDNMLLLPLEERELLNFVLDFTDGKLLTQAKELNGESVNSPLLIH